MARTDRSSRFIGAPLERVFNALVDQAALEVWLPPNDMKGRFERFDPRPGGSYRLVLTYAKPTDARGKSSTSSDIVEARYLDIVPNVRVVQAVDFESDDPSFAGTMVMNWAVSAQNGGTRVEITANDVPDGISASDHAAGMSSSLDNLADYLQSSSSETSKEHTISLATADRSRSLAFYRDGLELEAFGPLADDGVPEPLQLRLAPAVSLMLIPTGGFGWVAGEDRVAPSGTNECVLSVYEPDDDAVRARYQAAIAAGGTTVYGPSHREWGAFAAQVADPDGHLWMILVPPDWTT